RDRRARPAPSTAQHRAAGRPAAGTDRARAPGGRGHADPLRVRRRRQPRPARSAPGADRRGERPDPPPGRAFRAAPRAAPHPGDPIHRRGRDVEMRWLLAFVLLAVIGGGVVFAGRRTASEGAVADEGLFTVAHGDLPITLTENG